MQSKFGIKYVHNIDSQYSVLLITLGIKHCQEYFYKVIILVKNKPIDH